MWFQSTLLSFSHTQSAFSTSQYLLDVNLSICLHSLGPRWAHLYMHSVTITYVALLYSTADFNLPWEEYSSWTWQGWEMMAWWVELRIVCSYTDMLSLEFGAYSPRWATRWRFWLLRQDLRRYLGVYTRPLDRIYEDRSDMVVSWLRAKCILSTQPVWPSESATHYNATLVYLIMMEF